MRTCRECKLQKEDNCFRGGKDKNRVYHREIVCNKCQAKKKAEKAGREYVSKDNTYSMRLGREGKKRCRICGQIKTLGEFYKNRAKRDGYKLECKSCQKNEPKRPHKRKPTIIVNQICEYCNKEYQSHRKKKYCSKECRKERVMGSDSYKERLKRDRLKYHSDPLFREKVLQYSRDKHKEDRSKMLARKHKRKAKLKQQHDGTVDAKALKIIMAERKSCVYCGIKLKDEHKEIDHMNAICLGGAHSVNNLIVCCHKCNQLKKGKPFGLWLDYIPENRRQVVQKVYERKQGRAIEQEAFSFNYS